MTATSKTSSTHPLRIAPAQRSWGTRNFWCGIALAGAIAVLAREMASWPVFQSHGLSALTLAIAIGMVLGNTVYPRFAPHTGQGVAFAKSTLLRAGVVLYGLRLSFADVASIGTEGLVVDLVMLSSTYLLAYWLGTRVFKLEREAALLIGAGSSICGAAAVMAAEPVVRARSEQVTIAVATVVGFGTLAMFLWPWIYQQGVALGWLSANPQHYGIFVGATVHEVAQVVVAGQSMGEEAAHAAVITKMVRVMMLAPVLMLVSVLLSRAKSGSQGGTHGSQPSRVAVPWFAVGFVIVTALHSLIPLPAEWQKAGLVIDDLLLATAMAALGLGTHVAALRAAGPRPMLLAAVLCAWLLGGGLLVSQWVLGAGG